LLVCHLKIKGVVAAAIGAAVANVMFNVAVTVDEVLERDVDEVLEVRVVQAHHIFPPLI
jgi:hypothetical protein